MSELIADTAQDPVPGSDEYNRQMADRFNNPGQPDTDVPDQVPVSPMPDGGQGEIL